MATRSPEPSGSRRNSTNDANRDQPLFASRQFAPSQQPPDFFTESLNTSYVPSPSPAKSPPKRPNARTKPRPAFRAGRSLAAAFRATANNEKSQRPISSSSSEAPNIQRNLKPRPIQGDARPRSTPVDAPDQTQARTPSPARGRSKSFLSPVSSQHSQSSPPRGLAEAYQRIVDEESLADQESAADDMDIYGYEDTGDFSQHFDNPHPHQRLDESPISLKASRKASREPTPVRDYPENKENTHQESDDESRRSSLENITDRSLDSIISQHNKDARLINKAINSDVKIFSKARVGPKVNLTVENLRRNNSSAESLGSGSLRSRVSDPSLNLPRQWGRKSQPDKGWLSRINNRSGKLTGDVPKKQKADSPIIAESESREWDEPIDEWIQAAAETPMERNGSSPAALPSDGTTPTTVQRPSRDVNVGWDGDADFTARSLQVSDSPPIRTRNTPQNRIRDPEIDEIERQAVTTSRLGALREKVSQESLGREYLVRGTPQDQRRSSSRSLKVSSENKKSKLVSEASFEDAGDPIPDTPVVIYRNGSDLADHKGDFSSGRSRDSSRRPEHERQDSRDILQKLARATSASPAAAQEVSGQGFLKEASMSGHRNSASPEANEEPSVGQQKDVSQELKAQSEDGRISSGTLLEQGVNGRPISSKYSTRLQTPQVIGGWIDNTILDETPRPSTSTASMKTPFVTGAWIDTPLPSGGRGPPMPTPNFEDDKDFILEGNEKRKLATSDLIKKLSPKSDKEPLRNSSRPLPKSALESVLNDAKASLNPKPPKPTASTANSDSEEDPTLNLGESTIQSLEDILANETEVSSPPSPPLSEQDDKENQSPHSADLKPYTRQLTRLKSLLPSIRDARNNIAQLERAVATSSQRQRLPKQPEGECTEAGEFHDFIWPCERCGCTARSSSKPRDSEGLPKSFITFNFKEDLTTLEIPIPRLWRWRKDDWRPRFTWIGLVLFLGTFWWLAEGWMCDIYCHPLYAVSYEGYGIDINAPEPPWVLEKMLWRWLSIGTIARPIYVLLRALVRLAAEVVGWVVGFSSASKATNAVPVQMDRQPVSSDPSIPRPPWGPDLSMMDDEYL